MTIYANRCDTGSNPIQSNPVHAADWLGRGMFLSFFQSVVFRFDSLFFLFFLSPRLHLALPHLFAWHRIKKVFEGFLSSSFFCVAAIVDVVCCLKMTKCSVLFCWWKLPLGQPPRKLKYLVKRTIFWSKRNRFCRATVSSPPRSQLGTTENGFQLLEIVFCFLGRFLCQQQMKHAFHLSFMRRRDFIPLTREWWAQEVGRTGQCKIDCTFFIWHRSSLLLLHAQSWLSNNVNQNSFPSDYKSVHYTEHQKNV